MTCIRCRAEYGTDARCVTEPYGLLDVCDECWTVLRGDAWATYRRLLRRGLLVREVECSDEDCIHRPEGHHVDYTLPGAVVWLCPTHHREAHVRYRAEMARPAEGTT